MVSNHSPSSPGAPLGSGRRDYHRIDLEESHDASTTPSPSEYVQYGNGGYAPLNFSEQSYQNGTAAMGNNHRPSIPESTNSGASVHSKNYDHRKSRMFLLWAGSNRLCVTIILCLSICLTLGSYEGFNHSDPPALSRSDVRTFNAIILGLSLALGLNIASSLKYYGVLLRWTILTKRWYSLQAFDLILGCENLTSVFRLMILSFPGIDRIPSFQFRSIYWRQRSAWCGSRRTWLICLGWLLINVGAQALVAVLSIFWPVDALDTMPLTGNVSISNLVSWQDDSYPLQLSSANLYGISGSQYSILDKKDTNEIGTTITDISVVKGDGFYEYTFLDKNPADVNSDYVVSSRTIQSRATCAQFTFGDKPGKAENGLVEASLDGGNSWSNYTVIRAVGGQVSWTGMLSPPCGPRCTSLLVYQRADHDAIDKNSMFMCNSTLSEPSHDPKSFGSLREEDKPHVSSTDNFARIAAGAIAWTGYFESGNMDNQTRTYLDGLPFSPNHTVSKEDVQDIISRFSIGAIAAFDDHGPRYVVSNPQVGPIRDQQLRVDWARIIIILGWICLVQFTALILMLAFANKSIIRDESYFSVAMLLLPVVKRIGSEEGMNLSGEEIYIHPHLSEQRIRYDYVKIKAGDKKLKKVDLLFKEDYANEEDFEKRNHWDDGEYI